MHMLEKLEYRKYFILEGTPKISKFDFLLTTVIQRARKERITYLTPVTARIGRNILLEDFLSSGSKYQTRF